MAAHEFEVVHRLLARSAEIAAEPEMHPSVISVYNGTLKDPAEAFMKARTAVTSAEGLLRKSRQDAAESLETFDAHYKVARAVVIAFLPHLTLPDTLKAQSTDTAKLTAIEDLLTAINDNAGESWAAEILAGSFGALAPQAVADLNVAVAANKALAKARDERSAAAALAYAKFTPWKRVVREALGSKSVQYRRIHIPAGKRAKTPKSDEPAPCSPSPSAPCSPSPSAPAPSPGTSTAPSPGTATVPSTTPVPAPAPAPSQPPSPAPVISPPLETTPGAAPDAPPAP
jgi:hypothetical protein